MNAPLEATDLAPEVNFAYLDERTKRMIRRALRAALQDAHDDQA